MSNRTRIILTILIILSGVMGVYVYMSRPFGDEWRHHSVAARYIYGIEGGENNCQSPVLLRSGMSISRLVKFVCKRNSYVVRSFAHRKKDDIEREIHAMKVASEVGYGPKIYKSDTKEAYIIMEFIEQKDLSFTRDEMIVAYADLLRKMHHGPDFLPHHTAEQALNELLAKVQHFPKVIDSKKLEAIVASVKSSQIQKLVPTHQDLNPLNILFDGELKLIDFEDSGQGDPYIDLAEIVNFNFYDESERFRFMSLYLERRPTRDEMEYLDQVCKYRLVHHGLSILSKISTELQQSETVKFIPFRVVFRQVMDGDIDIREDENKLKVAVSFLGEALGM